jgi:hypothetical protein
MKTSATLIAAVAALLLLPATASAAGGKVTYAGKTSSGHRVTFQVAHGRLYNLRAGVRVSCVPIKGGTTPTGGADEFGFNGSIPLGSHARFTFKDKTALWFSEVTKTHDVWTKQRGNTITGRLRLQFSFLSPSFTPGVFTIYSCLGGATFTAHARH